MHFLQGTKIGGIKQLYFSEKYPEFTVQYLMSFKAID